MASLSLLKQIAEHTMEQYDIPWEHRQLLNLIERAKNYEDEIPDFEEAYTDTHALLTEVEENLLTMYKIRALYERYLAIKEVTHER